MSVILKHKVTVHMDLIHSAVPFVQSSCNMLDNTHHCHGDITDQRQATADLRGSN